MHIGRRDVLIGFAGALAASLAPLGVSAAQLRALRVGFASKTVNGQGLNTLLPGPLGYAAAAGFDLQPMHLGAQSSVQIALDRNAVDIGVSTPSFSLPLYARGELPQTVAFYEYTYPYKWDIAVKPNSPLKTYADLKGKRIGVSTLGTTDYPVTQLVLKLNGVDPKSLTWQAVGEGVTAGVALDRGAIDALAYYDVGFGMIDNAGIPVRFLPRPAQVPMVGGLFMTAKRDFVTKNRPLVVAYGRSMAMATEFILANPNAAAAAYLKTYPEAAPRGVSAQDAIAQTVKSVRKRITLYRPPYAGGKTGQIFESEWREEAKLAGLNIPDVRPLFTQELTDEINAFDKAPIIAAAKAYSARD